MGNALSRERAGVGLSAERRDPPGKATAARALRLKQRAQRQQVVGQAAQRIVALETQLEALQRPRQLALGGAPARDQVRERTQLVLLLAWQEEVAVAAAAAGDRQRPPSRRLRADPGQRRERYARRVEAKCGLKVAQAADVVAAQQTLDAGDWFDSAFADGDYCATEGEPTALEPGRGSR